MKLKIRNLTNVIAVAICLFVSNAFLNCKKEIDKFDIESLQGIWYERDNSLPAIITISGNSAIVKSLGKGCFYDKYNGLINEGDTIWKDITHQKYNYQEGDKDFYTGTTFTCKSLDITLEKELIWIDAELSIFKHNDEIFIGTSAGMAILDSFQKHNNNSSGGEEPSTSSVIIGGIAWSTCNVSVHGGSFVSKPEEYGGYFEYLNLFKYGSLSKVIPSGWRLPTEYDIKILYNAPHKWTIKNGVSGMEFGTAPNTIFLPASGFRFTTLPAPEMKDIGVMGYYMSSDSDNPEERHLGLAFSKQGLRDWYYRYNFNVMDGVSIRCVKE